MTRSIEYIGVALLAAAYLLPVGDAPWFSFWREWTSMIAALLIVMAAISSLRDLRLPLAVRALSLPALAFALAALCWLQWAAGLVPYRSDALLPSLYLLAFGVCIVVFASLPASAREVWADRLALAMAGAALASVPLAVLQWADVLRLDMNMPVRGGRPVAHMEQANLLCSLLIQGLFGVWRLAERRRVPARAALLVGALFLLTIVLTQSRVAWVVAALSIVILMWRRQLFGWRNGRGIAVAAMLALTIGTLLLPWLDAQLGLKGAGLMERVSDGRRPAAWTLFADAIVAQPWAGWGAMQNGTAQFAMADRHPSLGYAFSSAHNFVLDLMVWFGAPIGLLAGAALLWAVAQRLRTAPNSAALVSALSAGALTVHGLVELPLHYAYFLLPLGMWLGLTSSAEPRRSRVSIGIPINGRLAVPTASVVFGLLMGLVAREYITITDVRPRLTVDRDANHLVLVADESPPKVFLLDQLEAYHAFAALPLGPGLSTVSLERARVAMMRTPRFSSIERYAVLRGINGHDADALDALTRLCKFATPQLCARSRAAWPVWRQRWTQLPAWEEAGPSH